MQSEWHYGTLMTSVPRHLPSAKTAMTTPGEEQDPQLQSSAWSQNPGRVPEQGSSRPTDKVSGMTTRAQRR